jgi:thioredoxin-related protein
MEEIPFLKEMGKKYHNRNIRFVSICVAETKAGWKKFVKDRKLTGIQLFAPEQSISFFSDYLVRVIPRFILIDKEGKIIDANAKRPSNPKLKEEINKLI